MKEAGTNGIPPGIFKPHLMSNKEPQRIEEHQPLGAIPSSPRYCALFIIISVHPEFSSCVPWLETAALASVF